MRRAAVVASRTMAFSFQAWPVDTARSGSPRASWALMSA